MEDILNKDMADAIDAADISEANKDILRKILFTERSNKNRQWDDDDAVDFIISVLQLTGSENDSI